MDGVLGRAGTSHARVAAPRVISHGRWPVAKLEEGQTIRFQSKNYLNPVVMKIEKLHRFEKMVIAVGQAVNDVAFDIRDYVELVSVDEAV